jgi:ferredoxin-like protein FixX
MALWFFRGLRRGVVTTRYPNRSEPWAAELPSPPTFDPELVTDALADELVAACPTGALRRAGDELLLDVGSCTACGICVAIGAPALAPSREWELATSDRTALVKRIPIGGWNT